MTKAELRRHYRAIRKAHVQTLAPAERLTAAKVVQQHIEKAMKLPATLAGYAAMTSELDVGPALDHWRKEGHKVALPYFQNRESSLGFRLDEGARTPGPFGIDQPLADSPAVTPGFVLVPLVAVDRSGNRIGQGAGHYDRALAALRATGTVIAIGVCWDCQIADALPADPWDQSLDLIVTPTQTIAPR